MMRSMNHRVARDAAIRHRNAVAVDEPRHEDEGGEIFIQVHAPRVPCELESLPALGHNELSTAPVSRSSVRHFARRS